jgi:hypothetical protein
MALSDEDRRRIEEEEYRKLARERLERTVRVEADTRTSGDQRTQARSLSEQYSSGKRIAARIIFGGMFLLAIWMMGVAIFKGDWYLFKFALGVTVIPALVFAVEIYLYRRGQKVK